MHVIANLNVIIDYNPSLCTHRLLTKHVFVITLFLIIPPMMYVDQSTTCVHRCMPYTAVANALSRYCPVHVAGLCGV